MADRSKVLATADHLISKDRADVYGPPRQSFGRIGSLWGTTLGTDAIAPEMVALMLVQLKVSRIVSSPDHEDSWVDLCGYGALGGELATETAADRVREDSDRVRRWVGATRLNHERVEFDATASNIVMHTTAGTDWIEATDVDGATWELIFLAEANRG